MQTVFLNLKATQAVYDSSYLAKIEEMICCNKAVLANEHEEVT